MKAENLRYERPGQNLQQPSWLLPRQPTRLYSHNPVLSLGYLLSLLPTLLLLAGTIAAQTGHDMGPLELGKPLKRQLRGDQFHAFHLTMASGQYLQVVVEQHGIDLSVRLSGPDGKQVVEVDSLNGTQGPEFVFYISAIAGTHHLEVRALNKSAAVGQYEVRIEELRTADQKDAERIKAEMLFSEATLLRKAGTKESLGRAVVKYAEATAIFRSLNDKPREVLMLNLAGLSYTSLTDKPQALSCFSQALKLAHAAGDLSGEGAALTGLGAVYGLSEAQKGFESYSQALPLFHALGDGANEAWALVGIGLASLRLGNLQKARESYSRALPLARAAGEGLSEVRSLNGLGYVYRRSGERQKGLDSFNEALPIARLIEDRVSEADALTGLGLIHVDLGEAQKGLDYLLQSLPTFRAVGDRAAEAVTLNGMGMAYGKLVNKQKSLESFTQALPLARAVGDRSSEAMALIGKGFIDATLGETQTAIDLLGQALSIARESGDRQNEAEALAGLGFAYGRTGETQKAIESFNESLPILRATGNREGEGLALALLGFVYLTGLDLANFNIGNFFKAKDAFTRALTIAREIGNPVIEAQALNGLSALSLDNPLQALDYLTQSLSLSRKAGNRGGEADALNHLGFAYFLSNEPQKSIESFSEALKIYRAFNDRQSEATALINLAWVEKTEGQLIEARAHTEAALTIFESLRVKIVNQEGRKSYFSAAQDYYKFYIDLLMLLHNAHPSEGHDGEALQTNERSRARALLDTLNEAHADIRKDVDPQLLERERFLQQRLNSMAQDQMRLLSGKHTEAEAEAFATQINVLTTSAEQVKTAIRQSSPNYAALTQPQPLTLKEIQTQVLDVDTLLLEYSLGSVNSFLWNEDSEEDSYLWAVTSDSIKSYELPGRSEIEAGARQLYDLLNARNKPRDGETSQQRAERIAKADGDIPKAAASLSQMILAPVAAQLGKKRLVIVADGLLEYIPFAVLPVPAANAGSNVQPLIVDHEIVNLPSLQHFR